MDSLSIRGDFVGSGHSAASSAHNVLARASLGSVLPMKTFRLDPDGRERVRLVVDEIERLLDERKHIAVTVAEEQELLTPLQVADRLGCSRQHVVRLVNAGELEASGLPSSSYWQISLATVLAFEERCERRHERADEFSRSLDALGAPLE